MHMGNQHCQVASKGICTDIEHPSLSTVCEAFANQSCLQTSGIRSHHANPPTLSDMFTGQQASECALQTMHRLLASQLVSANVLRLQAIVHTIGSVLIPPRGFWLSAVQGQAGAPASG